MSARQLESLITSKCTKILDDLRAKDYPVYYEHRSGGGGYSYKKGIPDLFIVINGMHIECEMKTAFGHLSPMQEKWKMKCEKLNIIYMNPHSVDEFKEFVFRLLKIDV